MTRIYDHEAEPGSAEWSIIGETPEVPLAAWWEHADVEMVAEPGEMSYPDTGDEPETVPDEPVGEDAEGDQTDD